MNEKKTVMLDFDGVLHSYTTPWVSAEIIPDRAVDGSIEWLLTALNSVEIAILSARSKEPNGIPAMQQWLKRELIRWLGEGNVKTLLGKQQIAQYQPGDGSDSYELGVWADGIVNRCVWPTTKIPAALYIDDNGYRFEGKFPKLDKLLELESWVKEGL